MTVSRRSARRRSLSPGNTRAPIRIRRRVPLPLSRGGSTQAEIVTFDGLDQPDDFALVFGDLGRQSRPWVRVHSSCVTGDLLGSQRCDCGQQLDAAIAQMQAEGGVLLYLMQEGRGIGLAAKIDAYALQDEGMDTFEANRYLGHRADARNYGMAAEMLLALGVNQIRLLTANPSKAQQLEEYGVQVLEQVPITVAANVHNERYLSAKEARFAAWLKGGGAA
jgi:GTP cyclohydrolase II